MAINCPNCGSPVRTEGKFCSYCGAKLPDDTKHVEVVIDNIAEVKRAQYEEQESKLRQEKMIRELKKEKRKPKIILAKILSVVIPIGLALTGWFDLNAEGAYIFWTGGFFAILWSTIFIFRYFR